MTRGSTIAGSTEVHVEDTSTRETGSFVLLLLSGVAAYLYVSLFFLPSTPFLLGGDQVFFWLPGMRMLDHARIYQDFFQFTPPGTDFVYFVLFRLLGTHLWDTNVFVLLLGVTLCWMCFSIAREMMSRAAALMAMALFLVLIYCKLLSGTHHWLSVLCVMAAVKLWIRRSMAVATLAVGALLGLASFFTQTRGVAALAAFILFLVWRQFRMKGRWRETLVNTGLLVLGFAGAWLILHAYFIATLGWKQIWYFEVTCAKSIVGAVSRQTLGLPEGLASRKLPKLLPYLSVYLLLAIIYPVSLWRSWRGGKGSGTAWEKPALLAMVGLFLLAEVAFSLSWLRLYAVSVPAFILLGWNLHTAREISWRVPLLLWIGILSLAVWQMTGRYYHQPLVVSFPGGTVATSPEAYVKLHWFAERTKPGDYLFQAGWPGMYLPLKLRDPSYLESVAPADAPPPENVKRVPWELESKRVQYVLWSPRLDEDAQAPAMQFLRDYLHECYAHVHSFADEDEVWQRKEIGQCADCPQIGSSAPSFNRIRTD